MLIKKDGTIIIKGDGVDPNISEETKKQLLNLDDNIDSFLAIFSKPQQKRMRDVLKNNLEVNLQTTYQSHNTSALSDVRTIGYDESFGWIKKLNLSLKVSDYIKKHEFWHALVIPEKIHEYNGYISGTGGSMIIKETFEKYKYNKKIDDVLEVGSPIEEGMANITSALATIKEKAKR